MCVVLFFGETLALLLLFALLLGLHLFAQLPQALLLFAVLLLLQFLLNVVLRFAHFGHVRVVQLLHLLPRQQLPLACAYEYE